jgi:hypothetical protein
MAWCRELVLNVNRALFHLIDPETDQLVISKQRREEIFKLYFERGFLNNELNLNAKNNENFSEKNIQIINKKEEMNFEFNGFIEEKKTILFKLKNLIDSSVYDSLFLYTNFNEYDSFLLCDKEEQISSKCTNLFQAYGRNLPPLFEGQQSRELYTLKTININDLDKLVHKENYKYLFINIPVRVKKSTSKQLILKLDWYLKNDRMMQLEVPSLLSFSHSIHLQNSNQLKNDYESASFHRFYLSNFKNVNDYFYYYFYYFN